MPIRVSAADMERRKKLAAAQSAITNTMGSMTAQYGEFTIAEWLLVLNNAMTRLIAYELQDELKE